MLQNGKSLSMHSDAIYKGTYTNNGMLLKLHENSYTIGYSALLTADGSGSGTVKFGNGVFYNAKDKDNKVYVGSPTAEGAVPVFAGIMTREAGIASAYPVLNDEVSGFQNGMLAKEGFIIYKEAYVATAGALGNDKVNLYGNAGVTYGTKMFVRASDGVVYFGSAKVTGSSDVEVGKVVEVNPDDKSVTVYISPAIYA